MTTAVAVVNLVLGAAYVGAGIVTIVEMRRNYRVFGFSHLGMAWIFMAFTCGPHHLAHGIHVALEGRSGGPLDFLTVAIGLPAGITWLYLRVEAFRCGRGDRFVPGTPRWLRAVPALAVAYVGMLVVAAVWTEGSGLRLSVMVVINLALVVVYLAIGWYFTRTQLTTRPRQGGWSVSGLCLSAIFPTCAMMHAVWAFYGATGLYEFDVHGFVIATLSIPAGIYFVWVVRSLYRETLVDWNQGPAAVTSAAPAAEPAGTYVS